MSEPKIKSKLISENKKINWEPLHIRDGRFGEWLKDIKDWAISRERYWGTPLPVWQCTSCKKTDVVGSIEELKAKTKKYGNKYFVMRHGESESNIKSNMHGVVSSREGNIDHLTKKGQEQVKEAAKKLKDEKFDLVFVSPFMRTRDTLNILKENLKLKDEQIIFDKRLGELDAGDFEGKPWDEFRTMFKNEEERFLKPIHGGESLLDVKKRIGDIFYEFEKKYKDKNILIISHGAPLWMLFSVLNGYDVDQSIEMTGGLFRYLDQVEKGISSRFRLFANAEYRVVDFVSIPHNQNYELDLHRPYIDETILTCECAGDLIRIKEVMDVWFDSGAMPFAQDHYPFENKSLVDKDGYPADFISEAIDQTRGWFYTLHAVGVLLGKGLAYKNVICLGHLLDAKGKKMSKSLGNIVDPWVMMDKYGVDTLRLWMYSVNQPGESKNFDEKTVSLLHNQVFTLLYNVLAFYELYRDKNLEKDNKIKSKNILDRWILARLDELIKLSTENLDNYKLLEPVRGVKDFINDLSTWYLRRSRERIKGADREAKQTLYFVLKTLAKIMAPFAPFTAEDIWLKLKMNSPTGGDEESVHLAEWPKVGKVDEKIIEEMKEVRAVVSTGLKTRQIHNVPVRQPVQSIVIMSTTIDKKYFEIIKDELNVKDIKIDKKEWVDSGAMITLDFNITPSLKAEGEYREFMRELQDMRKKRGLNPGDKMPLSIEKIYKKYKIMPSLQEHMIRVAAVASIICDNFKESLPKEEIITACLLHDMGNIIKSKLEYFPEFIKPEGIEYWQSVKNEYIKKYGDDEHKATIKIMHELGISVKIISLVGQIRFSSWCVHKDSDDMTMKVMAYSDARVDPYGVVSYKERMAEGKKRHQTNKTTFGGVSEEKRLELVACGKEIEKQIFSKCKIKQEDINNETAILVISSLRNFVIK